MSEITDSFFAFRLYSCSCSSSLHSISAAPTSSSHTFDASLPLSARISLVKTNDDIFGA